MERTAAEVIAKLNQIVGELTLEVRLLLEENNQLKQEALKIQKPVARKEI
jgi:regulator of replication initiation timing